MRVDSLAITEADFFQTLLERHGETQRDLNELHAQLNQTRTTRRNQPCALGFAQVDVRVPRGGAVEVL